MSIERIEATTLSGRAFDVLRREILSGRLKPGEPLRLAALAKQLGFTMSVTREALTRLAAQTLVESSPNQGFRVADISRGDLVDLTQLRVTLECMALERSIDRGDALWEAGIVSAFHLLQAATMTEPGTDAATEAWIERHAAFHDALGSGCDSPRLVGLVGSLRDSAELYRQLSGIRVEGTEVERDVLGEHRMLMELALARDAPGASSALARHLELTTELLLERHFLDADRPEKESS